MKRREFITALGGTAMAWSPAAPVQRGERVSLSDYVLSEIRKMAQRPTIEELRARLEHRSAVTPSVTPAEAVRAERDRR